jgi:hypothetical protein
MINGEEELSPEELRARTSARGRPADGRALEARADS